MIYLTPEQAIKAAELAETWRVKLGFKPWTEHARDMFRKAAELRLEIGRRSGKTTFAILHMLAIGVVTETPLLYFGDPDTPNTAYCLNMARDMIAKLELSIKVARHPRPPRGGFVYYDHYQPRPCSTCYKPGHRPEDHAGWEPPK